MKTLDPLSTPKYLSKSTHVKRKRNGLLHISIKKSELAITRYLETTNWKLFVATL